VEAIGLLLVLIAWGLEWQSVKKWDNAYENYVRFVTSFNQAIYAADDQFARQFEFAVNRSVQQIKLDPHDRFSAYKKAWEYAEVRQLWLEQFLLELKGLEELSKNISEMSARYGLSVPLTLKSIENGRAQLQNGLRELVHPDDMSSQSPRIFGSTAISFEHTLKLRRKVRELVSASIAPLNELGEAMRLKSGSASKLHGLLFLLGSLLLVGAKLMEWWVEKKECIRNKPFAADS